MTKINDSSVEFNKLLKKKDDELILLCFKTPTSDGLHKAADRILQKRHTKRQLIISIIVAAIMLATTIMSAIKPYKREEITIKSSIFCRQ